MRKTKKVKAAKLQSAVSRVQLSGLDLVRTRKSRGKSPTISVIAKMDFEPWKPRTGLEKFIPSADAWSAAGFNCRLAHAICLKTRDDLIAMHGKTEHETIDAMMAEILATGEAMKEMAQMCSAAYARMLASAAAAYKRGVEFKFADGK